MSCSSEISLCAAANSCPAADVALTIHPHIAGGSTLIEWNLSELVSRQQLVLPLQVQVEWSRVSSQDASAWHIAQTYAANAGSYNDASQRVFTTADHLYYRLAIQDDAGTVFRTSPQQAFQSLHWRHQGACREVIRRWQLRARAGDLRPGKLLKRIRWGSYCTECRDRDSGVESKSFCLTCYGTGFTGGYYQPVDCFYGALGPTVTEEAISDQRSFFEDGPSGTLQVLNIPTVYPGDVWVENSTDFRYCIGKVQNAQRLGTTQLIATLEVARYDFSHPVYRFSL